MKNEDVAVRVDSDAGAFAELDVGRQPRPILDLYVLHGRRVNGHALATDAKREEQTDHNAGRSDTHASLQLVRTLSQVFLPETEI